MKKKQRYKIRNWREYNPALVKRGSLTLWLDEDVIAAWHDVEIIDDRGCPPTYSDAAILCALSLKVIFQLPLRATEGLLTSRVELMGLSIKVPNYTTLSRRQAKLKIEIPTSISNKPRHVVVDSTGLKIFGEGEWKVRQHGYNKRRTWRKLHLGIDEKTQEIVASTLTNNDVHDSQELGKWLVQIDEPIKPVSADGAYDIFECHQKILERGAEPVIPPRKDAIENIEDPQHPEITSRNQVVIKLKEQGSKVLKQESGYHRRSLAETAMFRIKTLFGNQLKSRLFENQVVESFVRCLVLNRMTVLGLPDSCPI